MYILINEEGKFWASDHWTQDKSLALRYPTRVAAQLAMKVNNLDAKVKMK